MDRLLCRGGAYRRMNGRRRSNGRHNGGQSGRLDENRVDDFQIAIGRNRSYSRSRVGQTFLSATLPSATLCLARQECLPRGMNVVQLGFEQRDQLVTLLPANCAVCCPSV